MRILMLVYFFPPLGGAGVQRSLKYAKYLPDEGWDPTIITVRAADYWMTDATLSKELGADVPIIRTAAFTGLGLLRKLAPWQAGGGQRPRGSSRGLGHLRRLAAWIFLPDSYRGWVPFATRAGARILRREPHDLIYTTSSPDSAHLIGLALKRRFGLPWVADFRDPWTRRMAFNPPTRWHAAWHRRTEERVLTEATLVTVTSEATRRDYLRLYPHLPAERIQVVTNGYDEADFSPWAAARPGQEKMQILHAGQLNPERPAEPFLRGLARFLERVPRARGLLAVRFIGASYRGDSAAAERMGLTEIVSFEPGKPHGEIIGEILHSHLLLLMEQESERGGLILPGKIFEYLRTRRPILGLLPRGGAAWELIDRHGVGRCCQTGATAEIAAALEAYYTQFEAGGPPATGLDEETLLAFERRQLTHRLAGLIRPLVTKSQEQ